MRMKFVAAAVATALVAACGGGQTEATEAEEGLSNDLQPAAPSPGTVVPEAGNMTGDNMVTTNEGEATNGAASSSGGNSQ